MYFRQNLNYSMCTEIAFLDKFDFRYLARKLSNKYVKSQIYELLDKNKMKSSEQRKKVNPIALKSVLWGFWGSLLWPIGPGLAIYYGHTILYRYRKDPTEYTGTDKRMAQGGLIFGYTAFIGWAYVLYWVLKAFVFAG